MSTGRADTRQRFLIESCDVRGDIVQLASSRREATANTEYPAEVDRLLGQAFVSALLLAGTIKFDGKMTFQVRGDGPIPLLVVQVTADGSYRGLARWREEPAAGTPLQTVFGDDARLTITIEARLGAEPYQGIVPLEGDSLAEAIAAYFRSSEQLATWLHLDVTADHAAGMLLQRLPQSETSSPAGDGAPEDDEGWERALALATTLEPGELATIESTQAIHRLYHQETVRVFDATQPRFRCSCSRERTDGMLQGLGQTEVDGIIAERGKVEIHCEFCDASYVYDAVDVAALFSGVSTDRGVDDTSPTTH